MTARTAAILIAVLLACGAATAQPRITAVLNNASYVPPGLQGSGIARGSIFAVFGENMGPSALVQSVFPLPVELSGTSVRISAADTTIDAFLLYTSAGQLSAVLPSNAPLGTAVAQVVFNGEMSAGFPFEVVDRSFGIFTISGAGSGAGVVTSTDFAPVTPVNTLAEGQIASLWGTGLGAVPFADNQPAQVLDLQGSSADAPPQCCMQDDPVAAPVWIRSCSKYLVVSPAAVSRWPCKWA